MRAVILCAGLGSRLALADGRPKVLMRFGDTTLLARHLRILAHCGIERVDLCLGYRAEAIIAALPMEHAAPMVRHRLNHWFTEGSVVSLWTMRESLAAGEPVLFMDADVLYDQRLLRCLLDAPGDNCFLIDRALEPGEEPVKLCLTRGRLVDIGKLPQRPYDTAGEWIGFARFSAEMAATIAAEAARLVDAGQRDLVYEEAFRAVLHAAPAGTFSIADATGLPWIEIDFAEDLVRAQNDVWPRLMPLPA